jgi:hypothetical protein
MERRADLLRALGAVPRTSRRWPWAVLAVLAGAAGGAAVAASRRSGGEPALDAVDPEQLRAVVDRPDDVRPTQAPEPEPS